MENFMQFKLIGSRIHMKNEVVPHKFLDGKKPDRQTPSQLTLSSRKRKLETLQNLKGGVKRRVCFDEPSTSSEMASVSHYSPIIIKEHACSEVESPSGTFLSIQGTEIVEVSRREVESRKTITSDSQYYNPDMTELKCKYVDKKIQVGIKAKRRSIGTITSTVCMRSCGTSTIPVEQLKKTEKKSEISESSLSSSSTTNNSSSSYILPSNIETTSSATDFEHFTGSVDHIGSLKKMSRFYLGIPPETYFLIEMITKHVNIPTLNILICLKKIRLNDANVRIADDLSISKSNVSKIFNKTVPLLASIFKQFITWQPAHEIQAHLPIPFRYRYRKVQSIIDCLEIEIDISSDAEKQAQTWSQYKHCNTIKYLISATPHGLINYISPGFGGRATDSVIVEKSGFMDVLPNNAHVMADRGFKQIASILAKKGCFLVRPPSVSSMEKPSKEEVKETKRIAALRIHIERVIRRLREFRMLKPHACINHKSLHLLDYIIIIACGIVNVQNPIIKS